MVELFGQQDDWKIGIRIVGWIGALLVLVAYLLVGRKIIRPESRTSVIMNLVGAAFLAIDTLDQEAYPSCALNVIWALIAVWNLFPVKRGPANLRPSSEG